MGFEEFSHVYLNRYESYKEFFPRNNLMQSKQCTISHRNAIMGDNGIG